MNLTLLAEQMKKVAEEERPLDFAGMQLGRKQLNESKFVRTFIEDSKEINIGYALAFLGTRSFWILSIRGKQEDGPLSDDFVSDVLRVFLGRLDFQEVPSQQNLNVRQFVSFVDKRKTR